MLLHKTKVYAFVGPSGTGKSYRAQMVAGENNINYIIDDGLLIKGNEVIAGISAKKAPTKIETVKNALFVKEEQRQNMIKTIKKYKPDSILILGTSDGMVAKIAETLELPEISKTIYINEVATEEEMETARRTRVTQGKHVIPVPTFEIKKDFSGYLVDPLQIFKSRGKGKRAYISEKSIIRPTFSYIGNFQISDTVFKQIVEIVSEKIEGIHKIIRTRITKTKDINDGIYIYIEVVLVYGYNIAEALNKLKTRVKKDIENLTAMSVLGIDIVAKNIYIPEKEEK